MNKKKRIIVISLSLLLIGFLLSMDSFSRVYSLNSQTNNNFQNILNSYDKSSWVWSQVDVISTDSTSNSQNPSSFVDSYGNVHVAWWDFTDYAGAGPDADVFYKKWDFSSSSWTATEVVSTESTSDSPYPSLAVDSTGNVHIAWVDLTNYAGCGTDFDIFYKHRNVTTSLWTPTEVISVEGSSGVGPTALTVDPKGNPHIVWIESYDYLGCGTDVDVFYRRWDDISQTWTTTEVVSTESTDRSMDPSIAADSKGNIHVAWHDYTDYDGAGTDYDIFYKLWNVTAASWTTTEVVSTESTSSSKYQKLKVDSIDNVHIAWEDSTDYVGSGTDTDIFYKSKDASSMIWTTTEVVSTESTGSSRTPSLSCDSGSNAYITWYDSTNYTNCGTDWDVFYKYWDSYSISWTATEVISSESTGSSAYPSIVVDTADNVHILWHDTTDYNGSGTDYDVFYRVFSGPPVNPILAFIVPNPSKSGNIILDWNDVIGGTIYHVYRSSSYIWSVDELTPIASISQSYYTDVISSEGFYYYSIVAESITGEKSFSNCEYVEVKFSELKPPILAPIIPNPTENNVIALDWDDVEGAIQYCVFRSTSFIWTIEELTPIACISSSDYIDTLPDQGFYYYVVTASDSISNSTSNCHYVEYEVPHIQEFTIIIGAVFGVIVILVGINKLKRKKQ